MMNEKLKVVGLVEEEDKEEVMLIWKVSLTGYKFRLVGQLARLEDEYSND